MQKNNRAPWLIWGIALILLVWNFVSNGTVQAQEPSGVHGSFPSPPFQSTGFVATRGGIVQSTFRQSGAIAPSVGDIDLIVDDGIGETSIGYLPEGQFLWLNRFTPAASEFPFTLTEIQLYTRNDSTCSATDLVDFYLYLDEDSNPANGAHYVSSLLNQPIGPLEQYNAFPVNIALGEASDVLIAVVNRTCNGASSFPAALDTTNTQSRSWAGIYNAPATTIPNPPPNPPILPPPTFGTIDSFGYPGNWMVRGVGEFGVEGSTPTPFPTPSITPSPTNTPLPTATSVVPEIYVEPEYVYAEHVEPQISTDTFAIHNVGSLTLTWEINESDVGDCSTSNDVSWFSVSPSSGTTGSGDHTDVTVTFDSVNPPLPDGQYTAFGCIASNDADTPLTSVIVDLYRGPMPTAVEIGAFLSPITTSANVIEIGTVGLLLLAGLVVLRRGRQ